MKGVFCAEVFTTATTATFTVDFSSSETDFNVSWAVPAGLYWLGSLGSPANPSLGNAFRDVLVAADPNVIKGWSWQVTALSDDIGAVSTLTRGATAASTVTITATNTAGRAVLWALGFRDTASIVLSGGTSTRTATTNGIPFGTWWPKANNISDTEFRPFTQLAFTSELNGSGVVPASVRMDDPDELRQWRVWRIIAVDGIRISTMRARRSAWSTGVISTNPTDAALDNPGWWWAQTLDGRRTFAYIEDETTLVSGTARYGTYRFWYTDDNPVSMAGWRSRSEPNITPFSPDRGRSNVTICAALVSQGNLT
jgi:hypothetical protein